MAAWAARQAIRMARLSSRSAAVPPAIESKSIGTPEAKLITPSISAELVSVVTTQLWAIICIHVPVIEIDSPIM
ncbi:hypothetical protein D3C72_544730 [compost metagenome]